MAIQVLTNCERCGEQFYDIQSPQHPKYSAMCGRCEQAQRELEEHEAALKRAHHLCDLEELPLEERLSLIERQLYDLSQKKCSCKSQLPVPDLF